MSRIYSIQSIHDDLKKKIEDYIETEYLGKNKALRNACHDDLVANGTLFKDLMVEANCGYELSDKKIYEVNLPNNIKEIIKPLVEANIGFFEYPYKHQVKALENFYLKKDLLVSTGTGSGKTECFLWPMVTKLVDEAKNGSSWDKRGIRAIILYPMNALVSDQESRLRRMIGDYDNKFLNVFNNITNFARRPQFGMYTGRTKYSGQHSKAEDTKLANILEKAYINSHPEINVKDEIVKKLKSLGKYPAKDDLEAFIAGLREGKHITSSKDAELLTRFEIRQSCPDILITNYSMLEYMMVRNEEQVIWDETTEWVKSSPDNKLLFIIDEAHMYKGSSGAEVALLIKRFIANLGVGRDKVQFILTSASFPADSKSETNNFICDLTNQKYENNNFEIITGEPKKFHSYNLNHISIPTEFDYDIFKLYESPYKYEIVKDIFLKLNIKLENYNPTNDEEFGEYLYNFLPKIGQVVELIKYTRGAAKSVPNISSHIFQTENINVANKVTEFLLAILPMAKNRKNQVLFPTRIHMMFRGITGLYACSNPNCNHKNHALPFGKLFVNQKKDVCECGAKVYELVNERNCGALFFKVFESKTNPGFIWNTQVYSKDLIELLAYIPDEIENGSIKPKNKNDEGIIYLNPFTGKVNSIQNEGFRLPIYLIRRKADAKSDTKIFTCPKCDKPHSVATDFATKGNEPFYNLISEQFHLQPQTIFDSELLKVSPNGGRKVLVFSDSRSKAARLARDLTRAADRDAFRKILIIALNKLHESAKEFEYSPTIELLYPAFLHVVVLKKVKLFYGSQRDELEELINKIKIVLPEYTENGLVNYEELNEECSGNILNVYNEEMLYHICSNFTSLTDLRMCYIEPSKFVIRKFKGSNLYINERFSLDDFKKIYTAWIDHILSDTLAYDKTIDIDIRRDVRPGVERYGDDSEMFNTKFKTLLSGVLNDSEMKELYDLICYGLEKADNSKFLQLSKNIIVFDDKKKWYICPRCGTIFPYEFNHKCMNCASDQVRELQSDDLKGIEFYTKPVYEELKEEDNHRILTINTMEHTAQLGSADENEDDVWTKAENYEMRFQDLILNDEEPIDVLSCTTTMEVGVDIGALTAIGLRDVPPLVENYQQRVGRAGRRGTSISTIVTYVENGPHDNFYFNHPEEIITGKLRKPWIDINNSKLVGRHFSLTTMNRFMLSEGKSIYNISIDEFIKDYVDKVLDYVCYSLNNVSIYESLIPEKCNFNKDEYLRNLKLDINNLIYRLDAFPEQFKNEYHRFISALDALIIEGIFPNYSFPRDVVSFYIPDTKNPNKIMHAPSRQIDVALSEYAPGKLIVVNKRTYRCGGFFAKGKDPFWATKNYLTSKEYYKEMYCCTNIYCNWMNEERPINDICPFCHKEVVKQNILKPWGFGPARGDAESDSAKNDSYSTSGTPIYAIISDDSKMKSINNYKNIKVENKYNQKLAYVNKGIDGYGFTICKKCGGATLNSSDESSKRRIESPFKKGFCSHNDLDVTYLGTTDIVTDMALFQIKLDNNKINCDLSGFWLRKAATTLVEAIILSSTKLLDIDYNELKGGYRVRNNDNEMILELFIFDSLTSGAGYSSTVSSRASEILDGAKRILNDCNCSSSCHYCLENFYNQTLVNNLDRFRGLELLAYIQDGSLPRPLSMQKQLGYAQILNNLFADSSMNIHIDESMMFNMNGKIKKVNIFPAMLNKDSQPHNTINIPDYYVMNAIPLAYEELMNNI